MSAMTVAMKAAAIILAGGQSSRMGTNKAFLPVGHQSIIAAIIEELRPIVDEIIVVTNDPASYRHLDVQITTDIIPGQGPLSGIHAGLTLSPHFYNLITACDLPFIHRGLAQKLLAMAPGYDGVVPRQGKYLQPLFAVYTKNCLAALEQCLLHDMRKMTDFCRQVPLRYVDECEIGDCGDLEKIFYNVNTPADLRRARELAEKELQSPIPVISIVGTSNSGKTTLVEKLLPELKKRGYRVATLKHSAHDYDVDHPGKDSWRHAQAGADVVVIASPSKITMIEKVQQEPSLDEILSRIQNVDIIITEGFKRGNKPKIEVFRSCVCQELLCPADELIAIASDIPWDIGVPCLSLDDAVGLAELIEARFLAKKSR
ncbi:molybdopterin-guanine dinucleotide biosynthesis protein B/molybdopterin-guanine dinucleotide biosynthesis protein [Heliophilum fasciatum]|uniref:Probable molybdenum cofactor guanylyltransferase n=2 Tax=Heliophilum fasciatum TaxID=35700 RepID=A0A4R2RUA7_9FIRM|nr:molybdopterin-guanine dinucleotide biosynthesis protein B/molybdopterin-guanine dinucleotide biosynthesis protein [Heliophilum fasciatum]